MTAIGNKRKTFAWRREQLVKQLSARQQELFRLSAQHPLLVEKRTSVHKELARLRGRLTALDVEERGQ